jgi:SAM-dependent methyltransferase
MEKEQTYWNNHLSEEHYNNVFTQWVGDCDATSKLYVYEHLSNNNYASIIDLGCGDASIYQGIQKRNISIDYTGVDTCKFFINLCKRQNINVIDSDIRNVSTAVNASYDFVLGRHVLEHQDNFHELVEEMIRLAKKEVVCIFFIKPDLTSEETVINYEKETNLYHNTYSYSLITQFLTEHPRVSSFHLESIPNTDVEVALHININIETIIEDENISRIDFREKVDEEAVSLLLPSQEDTITESTTDKTNAIVTDYDATEKIQNKSNDNNNNNSNAKKGKNKKSKK